MARPLSQLLVDAAGAIVGQLQTQQQLANQTAQVAHQIKSAEQELEIRKRNLDLQEEGLKIRQQNAESQALTAATGASQEARAVAAEPLVTENRRLDAERKRAELSGRRTTPETGGIREKIKQGAGDLKVAEIVDGALRGEGPAAEYKDLAKLMRGDAAAIADNIKGLNAERAEISARAQQLNERLAQAKAANETPSVRVLQTQLDQLGKDEARVVREITRIQDYNDVLLRAREEGERDAELRTIEAQKFQSGVPTPVSPLAPANIVQNVVRPEVLNAPETPGISQPPVQQTVKSALKNLADADADVRELGLDTLAGMLRTDTNTPEFWRQLATLADAQTTEERQRLISSFRALSQRLGLTTATPTK